MESNSITYDRYSNPYTFDERKLIDKINDIEKTVNAWQDRFTGLKETIEAIDQRTKILIHHYNLEMAEKERDNYETIL